MIKAVRGWLAAIMVLVAIATAVFATVWSIDPPWSVSELQGSVVNWGKSEAPNVHIRYHRMWLFVRTDDGRDVGVSSERGVPPMPGERVLIQERVDLLRTRLFVEIPSSQ